MVEFQRVYIHTQFGACLNSASEWENAHHYFTKRPLLTGKRESTVTVFRQDPPHSIYRWTVFKTPVVWVVKGIIPSCLGIIISQRKDPYEPISIMECQKGFKGCKQLKTSNPVKLRINTSTFCPMEHWRMWWVRNSSSEKQVAKTVCLLGWWNSFLAGLIGIHSLKLT